MDKNQFDNEVLNERISLIQNNEKRIIELEERISILESRYLRHVNMLDAHKE